MSGENHAWTSRKVPHFGNEERYDYSDAEEREKYEELHKKFGGEKR